MGEKKLVFQGVFFLFQRKRNRLMGSSHLNLEKARGALDI